MKKIQLSGNDTKNSLEKEIERFYCKYLFLL